MAEKKKMLATRVSGYDSIWYLVDEILDEMLDEKWHSPDMKFKGGDLPEYILREICRVFRERVEREVENKILKEELFGWELEEF